MTLTTKPPVTASPITRPSLLMRLRDHENHDAWSEFLEIYEPVIYRLATRRGMQDADAREIVQEVLLRVAHAIADFDVRASGSFRGWLTQTTRRVTIDRFRKLSASTWTETSGGPIDRVPIVDARETVETEFDLEHRQQLFRCAAESIRPIVASVTWQAFWETAVLGRGTTEVATSLGITEGAVYVARCRVLKRLRTFIEQREAE